LLPAGRDKVKDAFQDTCTLRFIGAHSAPAVHRLLGLSMAACGDRAQAEPAGIHQVMSVRGVLLQGLALPVTALLTLLTTWFQAAPPVAPVKPQTALLLFNHISGFTTRV
jgi:hypothetical protein